MWHVGVDLSWKTSMVAMMSDEGVRVKPRRYSNREPGKILAFVTSRGPFRAVIEATGSYRWLYELLSPHGEVILAHPKRLAAIWSARAKTDKIDAATLAELLRADMIPPAYIPPREYQELRDLTRERAKLVWGRTRAQSNVHAMLARDNIEPPFRSLFGPRGVAWLESVEFDFGSGLIRDERLERIGHFDAAVDRLDEKLNEIAPRFPQLEALSCLYGFALYSALLVVAELEDVNRFKRADQVGAYSGLTPKVWQSGENEHRRKITKEGSPWLRWILVEAGMKITRKDEALARFYERVRKRRGKFAARVGVARKLAEICWKRLMRWHAEHEAE
jgi:transposase